MFLKELTPSQKHSFLVLASELIKADKRLHPLEKEMFRMLREEMNLPKIPVIRKAELGSLKRVFRNKRALVILYVELVLLAYADGIYSKDEKKLIDKIGKVFGMQPATKAALEKWVKDLLIHRKKLMKFFK